MSLSDDTEDYGLVMPFVVVKTNGGEYDDTAFIAGVHFGEMYLLMKETKPRHIERYVPSGIVAQLDLAAMEQGYSLDHQVWEQDPEGEGYWSYVRLKRL